MLALKLANFACKRPFCRSVCAEWPGMTSYFLVRFYLKTVKKRNCSGLTVYPRGRSRTQNAVITEAAPDSPLDFTISPNSPAN